MSSTDFLCRNNCSYLKDKNVFVPGRGSACSVAMDKMLWVVYGSIGGINIEAATGCLWHITINIKLIAEYLAFGDVPEVINSVDVDRLLYVCEYNCTKEALRKVDKDVIVYPNQPTCNVLTVHRLRILKV